MPQEKPAIPPPRKLVSEFHTPSPAVVLFSEVVNRDDPAYLQNAPLSRGRLYSTIIGGNPNVVTAYPNLYFLKETRLGQSDQLVLWTWATVPQAEDTYNAEVQYAAESVTHPGFTRVYHIARDQYDASTPVTLGTPLKGLIAINVDDGGAGYKVDDIVDIQGTGTGATARLNVDGDGVITSVLVDTEGDDYTATPTVTVVSATGAGAVLIGIIQPQTSVLVSQKKEEFPETDPRRNEFVVVTRVYETLPGPYLITNRVDEDGFTIQVARRHQLQSVINATTPRETLSGGIWTRITSEGISSFIGWEVTEQRLIPGALITDSKVESGDPVEITKQMVATTSVVTDETVNGSNVWIKQYGKAISDLVSWQIEEQLQLPGVWVPSERRRSDGSLIVVTKRLNKTLDIPTAPDGITGGVLRLTTVGAISDLVSEEIVEFSQVPGPDVHGQHIDERYNVVIDITKTIVEDNVFQSPNPAADGTYYEVKPHDKWQSVQIASKFNSSLPEDVTWYGGQYHSFPPELDVPNTLIQWAEGTCGCVDRFTAVLQTNFNQYSGVVKARYTEQFYNGVPPDDVTIYQFFPQAHVFGFAFASVCGCGSDNTARVAAIAPQFHIPLCIHDTLDLSVGLSFTWHFDATTPSALPHGDYIMLPPHVERWRFGVFRRVLTEILVP